MHADFFNRNPVKPIEIYITENSSWIAYAQSKDATVKKIVRRLENHDPIASHFI